MMQLITYVGLIWTGMLVAVTANPGIEGLPKPPFLGPSSKSPFKPMRMIDRLLRGLRGNCSSFSDWVEYDQCIWPAAQEYEEYPDECKTIPIPVAMPETIRKFVAAKQEEWLKAAQADLKKRGATENCGMCSYKAKCRNRNSKHDSFFCMNVERKIELSEECDVKKACQLNLADDGSCSSPDISGIPMETEEDDFTLLIMTLGQLFPLEGIGIPKLGKKLGPGVPPPRGGLSNILDNLDIGDFGGDDGGGTIGVDVGEAYGSDYRRRRKRDQHMAGEMDAELKNVVTELADIAKRETINQWNCMKNKGGDKCLCCCGVHFPDADTEECVDVTDDMTKYVFSEVKKIAKGSFSQFMQKLFSEIFSRKRK